MAAISWRLTVGERQQRLASDVRLRQVQQAGDVADDLSHEVERRELGVPVQLVLLVLLILHHLQLKVGRHHARDTQQCRGPDESMNRISVGLMSN